MVQNQVNPIALRMDVMKCVVDIIYVEQGQYEDCDTQASTHQLIRNTSNPN